MVDGHSFETTMVRALKRAISPTDASCVLSSFSPFSGDPQPQATTDLSAFCHYILSLSKMGHKWTHTVWPLGCLTSFS